MSTRDRAKGLFIVAISLLLAGCPAPIEPGVEPPQPNFMAMTFPPDPIDHGIFADPGEDFIVLEWTGDIGGTTTGYLIYRSDDDTLNSDGILKNKAQIGKIESPNQLTEPLDTSFVDSVGTKQLGKYYYYQVQSYHTSGSSVRTLSKPSAVGYFALLAKASLHGPNSDSVAKDFLPLTWSDDGSGGRFQIVVRNSVSQDIVWSTNGFYDYGEPMSQFYNFDSTGSALASGQSYQWRVKKLGDHKGSSSNWQFFSVR